MFSLSAWHPLHAGIGDSNLHFLVFAVPLPVLALQLEPDAVIFFIQQLGFQSSHTLALPGKLGMTLYTCLLRLAHLLHDVPDPLGAHAQTGRLGYCFRRRTVACLAGRSRRQLAYIFCHQAYLLHVQYFIQQMDTVGSFHGGVVQIDPPLVFHRSHDCFDACALKPFAPIPAGVPVLQQRVIQTFQRFCRNIAPQFQHCSVNCPLQFLKILNFPLVKFKIYCYIHLATPFRVCLSN